MALSKTQNRRLGALLSVMFAEELTEDDLKDVLKDYLYQNRYITYQECFNLYDSDNKLILMEEEL